MIPARRSDTIYPLNLWPPSSANCVAASQLTRFHTRVGEEEELGSSDDDAGEEEDFTVEEL